MYVSDGLKTSLFSTLALVLLASTVTACIYEDEPPRQLRGDAESIPASSSSSSSSSGSVAPVDDTTTQTSTSAMLVEVDSDQTMNALPGEGVGVFVEYTKGGHWHVWWTCDTNQTSQSCDFSVSVSAASGDVRNIDASELAGGLYSSPTPSRLEATSTTSTEVRGFRFDTDAGGVITIEAALGDIKDGSFLFFVQDGKVNGGFTGKLTNPLRFQGNLP